MTGRTRTRLLGGLAGVLAVALTTGCGPTMADLPLPGNGVGGETIELKVRFDEALNLAQGAQVKVNGVYSGKVRSVTTEDFKALATLEVHTSAEVRADASARLRYTTPLGELFVDVANPTEGRVLADGETLDPELSTTAPTVEDALSSASLLVNGGGLNQLQTVTDQLNAAIGGREDTVRDLLTQANVFLKEANATTGDIDRALRALAAVSTIANQNRATIRAALRDLRPAAAVLRENTPEFTELLEKVTEFSGTANEVVRKTRADILQMAREVSPVLQEFLDSRAVLGPSLRALVSVSNTLDQVVPGDYVQLKLRIDFSGMQLPDLLGAGGGGSTGTNGDGTGGLLGGGSGGSGGSGDLGDVLGDLLGGLLGGGPGSPRVSASTNSDSPVSLSALLGGAR
jgi:phospholipid/cholesterol/gamma-HCH transport system substrate-binding protein